MTIAIQDTFAGTTGTALSAHAGATGATWTVAGGSGGEPALDGAGALYWSAVGSVMRVSSGTLPAGPYEVTFSYVVKSDPTGNSPFLQLCLPTGTDGVRVWYTGGAWRLQLSDDTTLGSFAQTLAAGTYLMRLRVIPATREYTLWVDTAGVNHQIGPAVSDVFTPTRVGVTCNGVVSAQTDSTGIHLGGITAQDISVSATKFLMFGPTGGTNGVGATFTIAPDGTATDTVNLAVGGVDWTVVPDTLSWTAETGAKTVVVTPLTVGTQALSASGSTLAVAPDTLDYAAAVGPYLLDAFLTPTCQHLWMHFRNADDSPAEVASVPGGLAISVNGGDPIDLDATIGGGTLDWVLAATCPTRVLQFVEPTTSGSWSTITNDGSHHFTAGVFGPSVYNNDYIQSSDASATATFAHTGLVPGVYQISMNLWDLVGPNRTAQARYTVRDGAATVLGTFDFDMTAALWPTFDVSDMGLHFHHLGQVTLPAGQTSLTITLTNHAGSGILVADIDRLALIPPVPATAGDTVTLDFTGGAVVTSSGAVGGEAAFPVTILSREEFMPFDPDLPRTLKIGYNKTHDETIALFTANRALLCLGWTGDCTTDANGELATITGTATRKLTQAGANGFDSWGTWTLADHTTFRVEFTCTSLDQATTGLADSTGAGVTFGSKTFTDLGGNRWRLEQQAHWPAWTPIDGRAGAFPAAWTYEVSFNTQSLVTHLAWFDDDTPEDWDLFTHPRVVERLAGHGFEAIRFLDPLSINNSDMVEFADFKPTTLAGYVESGSHGACSITAIRPVDLTGADADKALTYFPVDGGVSPTMCLMVATVPDHTFKAGQRPSFSGPLNVFGTTLGSEIAQIGDGIVIPLDADHLLLVGYFPSGRGAEGALPVTLDTTYTLADSALFFSASTPAGIPPAWCAQLCADCGVGLWLQVPGAASDACVTAMIAATLPLLGAGKKLYFEYENEPWNTGFQQWRYSTARMYEARTSHAADAIASPFNPGDWMAWYTMQAAHLYGVAVAEATALGRAADMVFVLGSQATDPGKSAAICATAEALGIAFDQLSITTYQGMDPCGGTFVAPPGGLAAYTDRLDHRGYIDLLAISCLHGGREREYALARAQLDAHGFEDVGINCYEGGWSEMALAGTVEDEIRLIRQVQTDPEMFHLTRSWLQSLDAIGYSMLVRYTFDYRHGVSGIPCWNDFATASGGVGTGDVAENANPADFPALLSQTGGAMRSWAFGADEEDPAVSDFSKPAAPALQAGNALASGLVRCLPFLEGTGSATVDLSASGADMTTRTAATTAAGTWGTDGTYGTYLEFDGADQDAVGADTDLPVGTAARSFAFLLAPAANAVFAGHGTNGDAIVGFLATGGVDGTLLAVTTFNHNLTATSAEVADGPFHLAGYAFDGTDWHLYLDGAPAVTPAALPSMSTVSSGLWYLGQIGGTGGGVSDGTNGIWSACRIAGAWAWDRALSDADFVTLQADPWQMIRPGATVVEFKGPAVGQVSVASTAFTLTPDGPATDVLTPSDGGAGGTFSPTTVTLSGTTPQTFTYTPASTGHKTITLTGTAIPFFPTTRTYNSTTTGDPDVATFNKFNAFVRDLGNGVHHLNATDVLKVVLCSTAPVATNSVLTDLTQITAGNGYSAGGTIAPTPTWTLTSGTAKLIAGDVTFTATGGSMNSFRYAALYNDTPTSPADPLIGFWDYGSAVVLLVGESLLVDFDGTNGVLTLT
jgi:hypothetical protein